MFATIIIVINASKVIEVPFEVTALMIAMSNRLNEY
jgi:hypothetical protein